MKKVGELKLEKAYTIRKEANQTQIARIMDKTNSRHIFVLESKKLLGIISISDIISRAISKGKNLNANELMTKNPYYLDSEISSAQALKQMLKQNQYSLPVLKNNELIGVLNLTTCLGGLNERS